MNTWWECPKCGWKITTTSYDELKNKTVLTCPSCKDVSIIQFTLVRVEPKEV